MKHIYFTLKGFLSLILLISVVSTNAQILEWRLVNPTYDGTDPDGAGPATATVGFTLQIRSTGANVSNVDYIVTGFSYQSSKAMIPTGTAGPGCSASANGPANITLSAAAIAAGFSYNAVNQCLNFTQTAGTQTFDRRAIGVMENGNITIQNTWTDLFTVRLWSLTSANPEGGYVVINSSEGGTPGEFTSYSVSDNTSTGYVTNSLTYPTPLELSAATAPITLLNFTGKVDANANAILNWQTSVELNSSHFNLQRSVNGVDFTSIAEINAAGNSSTVRNYNYIDEDAFRNFNNMNYRLEMVDKDGSKTYSEVVNLTYARKGAEFTLYPNPVSDLLYVRMKSDKKEKLSIQVMDMRGRLVQQMETTMDAGVSSVALQVSQLAQGEYMVVINGSERTVLKFIKK